MEQSPPENIIVRSASHETPVAFYESRRFITSRPLAPTWPRRIHFTSLNSISLRSISMFYYHTRLCLPRTSDFPTKLFYVFLISAWGLCDPLISFSFFYYPNNICWTVQIMKLLVMYFFSASCHSIPLMSKYSLIVLFSNTLNPWSSLNVRGHVSHSYKATCEIVVSYTSIQKTYIEFSLL